MTKHVLIGGLLAVFIAAASVVAQDVQKYPTGNPRIFLAGDSTVTAWDDPRVFSIGCGWGTHLFGFLRPGHTMAVRALGARTLWRFCREGPDPGDESSWMSILRELKPGDFVTIQFGHNDKRFYSPERFKVYLEQFIEDVLEKKATPILVTPVPVYYWSDEGVLQNALGAYPDAVREVAAAKKVDMVDLNKALTEKFNALGKEETLKYYIYGLPLPKKDGTVAMMTRDLTHFTYIGSLQVCRTFIEEAKRTKLSIAECFNDEMYTRDLTLLTHGDNVIIAWNEAHLSDDMTVNVFISQSPFIERFWLRGRKLTSTRPGSAKAVLAEHPEWAQLTAPNGKALREFDGMVAVPKSRCFSGPCFFGLSAWKDGWFSLPSIPWSANTVGFDVAAPATP